MKYLVSAVLALVIALPLAAQRRFLDLTGSVVWADPTGNGTFEDLQDPAEIEFEGSVGYGAAANFFLSDRISLEVAASLVSPETQIRRQRAVGAGGGDLEMIPITGILQFHLLPNAAIDPYIGAGAAYVLFEDFETTGTSGVQNIDFREDVALAVNAGVGIRLGQRFGLLLDAKYVPVESEAEAIVVGGTGRTESRIDVSPILLSAGLQLRF